MAIISTRRWSMAAFCSRDVSWPCTSAKEKMRGTRKEEKALLKRDREGIK